MLRPRCERRVSLSAERRMPLGWLCEYIGHFRYKWLNYYVRMSKNVALYLPRPSHAVEGRVRETRSEINPRADDPWVEAVEGRVRETRSDHTSFV